jgi:anti-anti-sigma regulatory factor
MSDAGRVTYARADGVHILRYHGRVTYPLATAIKRFADGILGQARTGGWIFDLSPAECLDSTNLGVVARIAELARTRDQAPVVILSTNEDITDVLRSMGFDQTFDVVTEMPQQPAVGPEAEIEAGVSSAGEIGHTMLDAHRMLMTLSDAARVQFEEVAAQLEADLSG